MSGDQAIEKILSNKKKELSTWEYVEIDTGTYSRPHPHACFLHVLKPQLRVLQHTLYLRCMLVEHSQKHRNI